MTLNPASIKSGQIYQHLKRGTYYTILSVGEDVDNHDAVVVYRANSDGKVWVRKLHEFADGRFRLCGSPLHNAESESGPKHYLVDFNVIQPRAAAQMVVEAKDVEEAFTKVRQLVEAFYNSDKYCLIPYRCAIEDAESITVEEIEEMDYELNTLLNVEEV